MKSRLVGTIISLTLVALVVVFAIGLQAHEVTVLDVEEKVKVADEIQVNSPVAPSSTAGWKCCVNPYDVNEIRIHPNVKETQDGRHDYSCPENPSNLSWYYAEAGSSHATTRSLQQSKWQNKTFLFVGGSTIRQMHEQFRWEMPLAAKNSKFCFAQFFFERIKIGDTYKQAHIIDLRILAKDLVKLIKAGPDFVILYVGTWWASRTIGIVIDEKGQYWSIVGSPSNQEWQIANTTEKHKPDFSFATLMKRAFA
jgi:hypothetical protein